ncbi:MAG: allantoinase, partial [Caldiserica bacterium]
MKLIKNGMVFFEGRLNNQDILIDGEKIVGIGKFSSDGKEIIDATGLMILPGGVDMHVHFNDPGYTHRETFKTGSMGAVSSGITTVVDMPCTSIPQVRDVKSLHEKLNVI